MDTRTAARLLDHPWTRDAAGGLLITLLLFAALHTALSVRKPVQQLNTPSLTDFIFTPRVQPLDPPRIQRPDPPKPVVQPPSVRTPVATPADAMDASSLGVDMPSAHGPKVVAFGPIGAIGAGNGVTGDGELIPLVAIAPQYPRAAARDGITGWVDVEIVIGPDGMVKSARVIDAKPRGVFDSAAQQAAFKSRFRPRTVDGKGVEARGVRRYNFSLGES